MTYSHSFLEQSWNLPHSFLSIEQTTVTEIREVISSFSDMYELITDTPDFVVCRFKTEDFLPDVLPLSYVLLMKKIYKNESYILNLDIGLPDNRPPTTDELKYFETILRQIEIEKVVLREDLYSSKQ